MLATVNPTVNTPMPGREIQAGKRLVGRIWPTGRFSMAWRDGGGLERGDKDIETQQALFAGTRHPIGLSNDLNSHRKEKKARRPRGMKGITPRGRRIVESAAFLLEERYGKAQLSFVTLTLPSVSSKESWWLSSNWAEIVRVFFQRLMRSQARKGLPCHYVSVTELQEKRAERERHPALHLHFVMPGRRRGCGWGHSPKDIRGMWADTVAPYLEGSRDWTATENVQQVRRTTEGYLAKYLSKGVDLGKIEWEPLCGYELPKAWYSVSRTLLRAIASQTITSRKVLESVYEAMHRADREGRFEFLGEVKIPWMDGEVPVAIYGMIERAEWRDWREVRGRLRENAKRLLDPPKFSAKRAEI